jgi:hypothetical protein
MMCCLCWSTIHKHDTTVPDPAAVRESRPADPDLRAHEFCAAQWNRNRDRKERR